MEDSSCDLVQRAFSRGQIKAAGFDVSLYEFSPLPIGYWQASLDNKAWGKTVSITCYFTCDDGRKFKITAFRSKEKRYSAKDGVIDFSSTDIKPGQRFRLNTGVNGKGKPLWLSAELLD